MNKLIVLLLKVEAFGKDKPLINPDHSIANPHSRHALTNDSC